MSGVEIVARAVGVSVRRIQQVSTEPGFPAKHPRDGYDLIAVMRWFIGFQATELMRRGVEFEPGALRRARHSLLKGQREKVEMANRVQRGELLEKEGVFMVLARRMVNCRDRMRGIPSSLGPQLTSKSAAYCTERISDAIEQALQELEGGVTERDP